MKTILEIFNKNERYISPIFLIGGFVLDNLTIRRPDLFLENLLLGTYLLIAGIVIFLINKYPESRFHSIWNFVLFFTFGGLFSVFTVFYSRSAALISSWPFLVLLFCAMISTEYLRKQYQVFNIQIGIYFLALFSFLIFHLPTVTGIINYWIFIASGLSAIVIIYFYLFIIKRFLLKKIFSRNLHFVIIGIFIVVNVMYFFNIIPPVPLVMKDAEIARKVIKTGDIYKITDQENDNVKIAGIVNWREKIYILAGQEVYFFNSVFAPAKIQTEIYHNWQKYDDVKKEWKSVALVKINLQGGRDGGYRSYSAISKPTDGKWRVVVETKNGQIIGVHNFIIEIMENLFYQPSVNFER